MVSITLASIYYFASLSGITLKGLFTLGQQTMHNYKNTFNHRDMLSISISGHKKLFFMVLGALHFMTKNKFNKNIIMTFINSQTNDEIAITIPIYGTVINICDGFDIILNTTNNEIITKIDLYYHKNNKEDVFGFFDIICKACDINPSEFINIFPTRNLLTNKINLLKLKNIMEEYTKINIYNPLYNEHDAHFGKFYITINRKNFNEVHHFRSGFYYAKISRHLTRDATFWSTSQSIMCPFLKVIEGIDKVFDGQIFYESRGSYSFHEKIRVIEQEKEQNMFLK